jgi:hypothetical protein
MDMNPVELLAKEEVFEIVGCAIEVLNTLGRETIRKRSRPPATLV